MKLPASRREWKEILPLNLSGTGRCLSAQVSRRTGTRVSDSQSRMPLAVRALGFPSVCNCVLCRARLGSEPFQRWHAEPLPGGVNFGVRETNSPLGLSETQRVLLMTVLQFSK